MPDGLAVKAHIDVDGQKPDRVQSLWGETVGYPTEILCAILNPLDHSLVPVRIFPVSDPNRISY